MQIEEKIWLTCFQREEYWCGSHTRTGTPRRTPLYSTIAFSQLRKAWLKPFALASTPLRDRQRRLLPWLAADAVLRIPLHPHPIDAPRAQIVFLKGEDHRVWGKSREFENEIFENFQVKERMKIIKEIHEHFGRFFY